MDESFIDRALETLAKWTPEHRPPMGEVIRQEFREAWANHVAATSSVPPWVGDAWIQRAAQQCMSASHEGQKLSNADAEHIFERNCRIIRTAFEAQCVKAHIPPGGGGTPEDDAARDFTALAVPAVMVTLNLREKWENLSADEQRGALQQVQAAVRRVIDDLVIDHISPKEMDENDNPAKALARALESALPTLVREVPYPDGSNGVSRAEYQSHYRSIEYAGHVAGRSVLRRLAVAWAYERLGRKYVPQPPLGALKSTR